MGEIVSTAAGCPNYPCVNLFRNIATNHITPTNNPSLIMHLQTPTTSLTLAIVGYEFPDLKPHHNNPYDPNWLQIRITATTPDGTWTVTDPSLLTFEISELIDWLTSISTDPSSTTDPILRFTEPNISFYITQSSLQVHLAAESKPPWSRYSPHDTILTFPLSDLDLPALIHSLKSQLAKFPARNHSSIHLN